LTNKEKNILIYSGIGLVVVGIYLSTRKPTSTLGASLVNPNANINKDGSKKKPIVSQSGVPSTVVDAAGDYIENSDNSTLYNAKGDVIGNINTAYGMFVDTNGNIIAASDGTPVVFNVSNNTYTEPDGTIYNIDGTINTTYKTSNWTQTNWFTRLFTFSF
jgi:phosphohistidine swiveling domain-containing protein